MNKIKIHIRNNHWKKGSLPCDLEGEKNSSVPKGLFERGYCHWVFSFSGI